MVGFHVAGQIINLWRACAERPGYGSCRVCVCVCDNSGDLFGAVVTLRCSSASAQVLIW